MTQMLQLPTVPGLVDGIVSRDPWTLQCRECGLVATKPDNRRVAAFVILAGFLFCRVDGVRRCPACRVEHRRGCDMCRKAA